MDELFHQTVILRMGERIALTGVIVILALVVAAGFWRSLSRVELSGTEKVGLAGNVVLATPVFVLLALVGYAWVTLNAPVTVEPPAPAQATASAAPAPGRFTGAVQMAKPAGDAGFARLAALDRVRSLNCLAAAAGPLSPRIEDDLAETRLALMQPVWLADWGDAAAFADWAMGRSSAAPNPAARAAFDDRHPVC